MATKQKIRKELFALFSANCITCKHLCPELGTTSFSDCHHKSGNILCPASEVKFVVVGEALSYAKKVLKARDTRNATSEARLMKHVGLQTTAFKDKFYTYLENNGKID